MRYLLLSALCLSLLGCAASRIESKRARYVESHSLSTEKAQMIRDGRVWEGMSVDAVIASLGRYDQKNTTVSRGSATVQLVYDVGRYRHAYVYLGNGGVVTGWQNVCMLPYSCR